MTTSLWRTVGARFFEHNHTIYSYLVPRGDEPKVGDLIVTSIRRPVLPTDDFSAWTTKLVGVPQAMRVAVIVCLDETPSPKATKFYLKRIAMQELEEAERSNERLKEQVRKRAEAMKELDRMLRDQSAVELYRKMAAINPRAAELLAVVEETADAPVFAAEEPLKDKPLKKHRYGEED